MALPLRTNGFTTDRSSLEVAIGRGGSCGGGFSPDVSIEGFDSDISNFACCWCEGQNCPNTIIMIERLSSTTLNLDILDPKLIFHDDNTIFLPRVLQ